MPHIFYAHSHSKEGMYIFQLKVKRLRKIQIKKRDRNTKINCTNEHDFNRMERKKCERAHDVYLCSVNLVHPHKICKFLIKFETRAIEHDYYFTNPFIHLNRFKWNKFSTIFSFSSMSILMWNLQLQSI